MKKASYRAGKLLVRLVFGCVARIRVLGREHSYRTDGFLLAANHISHFDPFLIGLVVQRKIDWMTMSEFFRPPVLSMLLNSIDAFPAARDRADPKTIRTAIDRLKDRRIVGIFPEGGIRDGTRSLLEGAPLRRGAATLAEIASAPILPCVILGSDRFYSKKQWLPLRRTPVWIAFGKAISHFPELQKTQARERIESELAAAFESLYAELRQKFHLTTDDLPRSPQARISSSQPKRSQTRRNYTVQRTMANAADSLLCGSINFLHRRHRLNGRSREQMERYLTTCERLSPLEYYAVPQVLAGNGDSDLKPGFNGVHHSRISKLTWRSPIETQFAANNTACADFFRINARKWQAAPTVFLLHSLMSTKPTGYYRCAEGFNKRGWNACFVHLPYHFSRVPAGYRNGELAVTPDLTRNAQGLRQSVIELRQLMESLRAHGCREFGVLATSYGGWIGSLLTLVERNFRFVALMSPIVNVEHAIWQSPAARCIRSELLKAHVEPALVARHFHLSSPLHGQPVCDPARILFVAGEFDSIAPPAEIEAIHQTWRGSELLRVRQGHFGHRMMPETIARLAERGDL
ncbi:MAG TPA: lysophospholipid acyltransferase family protein [Candidatus Udaeobacter sp.]|jgi:1-acyl-sn-glycerol-3-phosphate acyltransferase|nr:lysophospholipid acyltransferase family protein [Candidatus Udaeobacter sp.]